MKTIKEKNFIKFKFGNIKFLVKKEDAFLFYATFIADEYNNLKIKRGDIVLDLGANVGDFTIKAGKLLNGTGKIIAVEPNQENIEILRMNLELNNVKNAEILEYAITDKDGYSYLTGDGAGAVVTDNITNQKIRTMSVNSLLEKLNHPKDIVVKMDIEGAERYFFNNQEFINSIREIVIELHGKENVENIKNIRKK
jgi:FkbM family methyltransferase